MTRTKFTQPMNISALKLYSDRNKLHIPEVQRDLVWTISQKQLLIDSIIKDFDIPKIYFHDTSINGETIFDVIDGQQRINAIIEFMDDKFEIVKDSDKFENEDIAGKKWSEMSPEFQIIFQSRTLDVVHLQNYSKEEIDETFLRLQNGTPLKAAEKRRAIAGNMRNVVADIATHKLFEKYCDFSNDHFSFEDVSAKTLKQITTGIGPIGAKALSKFYENNPKITENDTNVRNVKKAYNFLCNAFKDLGSNPKLKRYAVLDLAVISSSMLNAYDLGNYAKEFGKAYIDFLDLRAKNNEKSEDEQDPKLLAYSNAIRADSLEYIKYRQDYLRDYFFDVMPYLEAKDNNRNFTQEQKSAIYRRDNGICQICGKPISEDEFEADHKKPWAKGGKTTIANGQCLCMECNRKKSDS